MLLDPQTGYVSTARLVISPNYNHRPDGIEPDLIVIHNISLPPGEFGGPWIEALFTNQLPPQAHPYFTTIATLKVSAHFLIRRTGELVQFVPVHLRAWHAGVSCFQGRTHCNDFSIGIELEGTDTLPYTEAQYQQLLPLIALLRQHYPAITLERITGHSDIAPGRKTDPGSAFDWQRLGSLHETANRLFCRTT